MVNRDLYRELAVLFDADWYLRTNDDVRRIGLDPLEHYIEYGAQEGRPPCRYFDAAWYLRQYPDLAGAGIIPFLHYIRHGGPELRNPHPRFDAAYYVDANPDAWGNPLLHYQIAGARAGLATERQVDIAACLPVTSAPATRPTTRTVDVIIPVYRGLAETRRCLDSVLTDPDRPPGRVIVIDDRSPEPRLSAWLDRQAKAGRIHLLRNARNMGFVTSVNRGMREAGGNDVVLLNADTEVPPGWLARLATAAYTADDIATVSPFSNNATICSFPDASGGPMPAGQTVREMDAATHHANAGRVAELPTTVGFCMYIRRAALKDVGPFDAATFGRGYGEEVDFCLRARARGWRHLLACDVFVFHQGEVSFGAEAPHAARARALLDARYPDYAAEIARFVRLDPAGPARQAFAIGLTRASALPTILLVGHGLGGGVRRQMEELRARLAATARVLLMEPAPGGVTLRFPDLPGLPDLILREDQTDDLAMFLRAAGVARVHVHHVMGIGIDLRAMIATLGVAFDFTVHDYYTICPQVNFLPFLDAQYCGEPEARHCNACLAANPAGGAHDINSWRARHGWLLQDAARVICPSEDVRKRLERYGLQKESAGGNALVAAHEPVTAGPWPLSPPVLPARGKLRVALLGVLADRKGRATVEAVLAHATPDMTFHLIGYPETPLDPAVAERLHVSGAYNDADLAGLITRLRPHVIWFPAQWPETYSYTLSAGIAAGAAILASRIGAHAERLAGRPLTTLLAPDAPAADWVRALEALGATLRGTQRGPTGRRRAQADFYARDYTAPLARQSKPKPGSPPAAASTPHSPRLLLIPEEMANGALSPCAHIRLLQPMTHPDIAAGWDVQLSNLAMALRGSPRIVLTHRLAVPSVAAAEELAAHCRATRARLIYDLDDDLLNLPDDHPEAELLRPRAQAVRTMVKLADEIWVSTPELATRLDRPGKSVRVIPNGLDERLLWPAQTNRPPRPQTRLLIMGTATHTPDFALIAPVLEQLARQFGPRIGIDIIGMTDAPLPAGTTRLNPPAGVNSYPAFMNWLSREQAWDIGLAPLADTQFNRAKSAIKQLDYAALGLPCIASQIGVYDTTIKHGETGLLVNNTPTAWFNAIASLIRDPNRRHHMATQAHRTFTTQFTLAAQAAARRRVLGA